MTPIESIFEIKSSFLDLERYLNSKDVLVARKARKKYGQLVDRFFREHGRLVNLEQHRECLNDHGLFLKLLVSVEAKYYCD